MPPVLFVLLIRHLVTVDVSFVSIVLSPSVRSLIRWFRAPFSSKFLFRPTVSISAGPSFLDKAGVFYLCLSLQQSAGFALFLSHST